MFKIIYTNRFDKSLVKCAKRGLDIELVKKLIKDLRQTGTVPAKHLPHILSGKYDGIWECHIICNTFAFSYYSISFIHFLKVVQTLKPKEI